MPNAEMIQSQIVSYLMQAVHSLLPAFKGRVGIAFPAYGQQRTAGGILRLLGDRQDIDNLNQQAVFNPILRDYSLITPTKDIPEQGVLYACYHRVHAKGNSRLVRLKKWHKTKGTWTNELHKAILNSIVLSRRKQPYIRLNSASSGQPFLLFIEKKILKKEVIGTFNGYGLSQHNTENQATVPDF